MQFQLQSQYAPAGDQPEAIRLLTEGLNKGAEHQTLLGVTGSGKTFTMANIIQNIQKPTLVLAHNKTLAAQLFAEFKEFFPHNAVNYFISYYDYYQPEAYVPSRDLFIEKETDINEDIERYRNASTQSALSRSDVIIVASVSCIYGLGDPEDYSALARTLHVGETYPRDKLVSHLIDMQYHRSEFDFYTGLFRVRGDVIDINLVAEDLALRIEFFGDTIESMKLINSISGEVVDRPATYKVFPARQYVEPYDRIKEILPQIRADLEIEREAFMKQGKILEATRLQQRVSYDLEMLQEVGFCTGIENYSRYFDSRAIGSPPSTLLDYLGEDWLMFVDESHMSLPQVRGMYFGDRVRKETLVEYGFRLRAAMDNRPLTFEEFTRKLDKVVYVSATPAPYELQLSGIEADKLGLPKVVEQIIRPTGLLDPQITVKPSTIQTLGQLKDALKARELTGELERLEQLEKDNAIYNQVDDLLLQIKATVAKGQRVLVTTLTKRMAEDLSEHLQNAHVRVQYLHSDIETIERMEILRNLRLGVVDVVIGINLLREGLDLPEVSLVAILDADKEGFLRSEVSFIQTIGRAARHPDGRVIMYSDRVTDSMVKAISETNRRRTIQHEHNVKAGIVPWAAYSKIKDNLERGVKDEDKEARQLWEKKIELYPTLSAKEKKMAVSSLKVEMEMSADTLEFEKAAKIRDFLKGVGKLD